MAHEAVTSETPVVTGLLRVLEDPVDPQSKVFRSPVEHGNEIFTANAALLSSVVHEVGGFDESLPPYGVEDSELSIRVIAAGYDINAVLNMVVYFRETNDPHVKMRKIYMSGQAEVVLRARWARDAGRTYGYKALFKELGKIPVESVSAFRDGGVAGGAKWLLRQVPLRVGRLTGYREWYASGKAEHPRLPLLRSQD